jgi:hypothetical protein
MTGEELTRTQKELGRFEPEFCANCGREFENGDVKKQKPRHDEQLRWQTFCGYCGAIYTVEIEP